MNKRQQFISICRSVHVAV